MYEDMRSKVLNVSVLGNFEPPLSALKYLVSLPVGAKSLVSHESWVPWGANVNGRTLEFTSVLGAFFHISALPDLTEFESKPDVGQCFWERYDADLEPCYAKIINGMNILYSGLHDVLMILLKSTDTCECVLQFLAEVINANASRAKIEVDLLSCASLGMFVNLSAVMLRLCEPYLDLPSSLSDKIDPKYVSGHRLKLSDLTALHASSEEVSEWIDKDATAKVNGAASSSSNASGQNAKSTTKYTLICEYFFMTARVLNLGLLQAFSDSAHLSKEIKRGEDILDTLIEGLETMRDEVHSQRVHVIHQMKKKLLLCRQQRLCYEAQIWRDFDFIKRALSFYRLVVVWLVELVGGFKMPLPSTCPKEFSCMPEHVVDDAMDLLMYATISPLELDGVIACDGVPLDDFMDFIIMFMASPEYVRNPYLRGKMVDVLICWMSSDSTSTIFKGHQLSLDYLVRSLLQLHVDIEITGSHTQFNDKFKIRHGIAKVLEYLWEVPSHRNAWKRIAKEEEKGVNLSFLNVLVNDIIYFLDQSLEKMIVIKQMEAEVLNIAEWKQRTTQEKRERRRLLYEQENDVAYYMKQLSQDVTMLEFTSEEITAPFLLPEMVEIVANLLNYFLLHLVGPKRESIRLRIQILFCPKTLLKQIVRIYVNLARGDTEKIFPGAISRDDGSCYEQIFNAGADELRTMREDGRLIQEFVELGTKAKAASEAELDKIPEEFLDPIQHTLMRDPVILPSSKMTVDKLVILRHLRNYNRDPFSQLPLTSDMLKPDIELKAKIDEFVKSHQSKKRTSGEDSSNYERI